MSTIYKSDNTHSRHVRAKMRRDARWEQQRNKEPASWEWVGIAAIFVVCASLLTWLLHLEWTL